MKDEATFRSGNANQTLPVKIITDISFTCWTEDTEEKNTLHSLSLISDTQNVVKYV